VLDMKTTPWLVSVLGVLLVGGATLGVGSGCGGGGAGGAGGTGAGGSGNTGGGGPLAGPCTNPAMRVGGFSLSLVEMMGTTEAHIAFGGGVRNGARPQDIWTQEGTTMGGCRLMIGPTYGCTPACVSPQICGGPNTCVDEPRFQAAGTLTLSGVGPSAVTIDQVAPTLPQYSWSPSSASPIAYPPFSPGANVHLTSSGATIPAVSLGGRGIEPLAATETGLMFTKGEAFTFHWTAPAQAGDARIYAGMEIAHHGGVAARLECELPDTGMATVPEPLLTALIDKGLFGFPELTISRATYDSVSTAGGCVDFGVVSSVARQLIGCTAPGMCKKSCNDNTDCTAPQTCQMGFVCGT
jgi:hypothetical protein